LAARWRGWTMATMVKNAPHAWRRGSVSLCLFRGPEGTPLAVYRQKPSLVRFTLSDDGRLLARQIAAHTLEVRSVDSGQLLATTPRHGFHNNVTAAVGDRCLLLRCGGFLHMVRWADGRLACTHWKSAPGALAGANAVRDG